jgi:hypothetical protein
VDAVSTLLRVENQLLQEQFGTRTFPTPNRSHKLECESVAEREFRIKISTLICSMLQGYQENISFVSATKPVFNQDRFLKKAPFLLEESTTNPQVPNMKITAGIPNTTNTAQSVVSSKAISFLTCLVNTQQFHGLIDNLDDDEELFFHDIMENLETLKSDQKPSMLGSITNPTKVLNDLLEQREHEIPSYIIKRDSSIDDRHGDQNFQKEILSLPFTHRILLPNSDGTTGLIIDSNIQRLDILELHPWSYQLLFGIDDPRRVMRLISLKEAMGEERFK